MELVVRFDYGRLVPWARRVGGDLLFVSGRDSADAAHGHADRTARTRARSRSSRSARVGSRRSCCHGARHTTPPREPPHAGGALEATLELVARMVRAAALRGRVARRGPHFADGPQGTDLRADRRHRRGADDVAARAHRRRAQLGLPLLLAARRGVHPVGAQHRWLHRGGARLAQLAAARRRRRSRPAPGALQRHRRVAPRRADARPCCRATRARRPCASATPQSTSFSSTSTARCSTRCTLAA